MPGQFVRLADETIQKPQAVSVWEIASSSSGTPEPHRIGIAMGGGVGDGQAGPGKAGSRPLRRSTGAMAGDVRKPSSVSAGDDGVSRAAEKVATVWMSGGRG